MAHRFGDEIVYTFRHLLLDGPLDRSAALATEAAGAQGRFWEMRDALLLEAPLTTERQVMRAAVAAGLGLHSAPSYVIANELYEGPIDARSVIAAVTAARDAARGVAGTAPSRTPWLGSPPRRPAPR
ncbi:hypothetical protein J4G33_09960 [Actinotalea sp. BY-33]|uniref:DSBA-like thioredoxin domain-containing protein n=1 Tax=Actinotalea soli TaxID=2819234 RepID=A0A939LP54_9CELL|nr:hypothetical protein [Actinotalea soli]MBO1752127.1 hypothetical protein [Actinotalea soli]